MPCRIIILLATLLFAGGWTHGVSPLSVPNQTLEFGALTLANSGDVAPVIAGVGTITSASCSGTNYTDFNAITPSGVLTAASNGSLSHGPYTLSCTFNGSISATLTINTTGNNANGRDLSKGYSAANITQANNACLVSGLALGQIIFLRDGKYNQAQASVVCNRSVLPTGTFTPPSLKSASHPDQGSNLDSANFVLITKHAGATPIVYSWQLKNTAGGMKYFRISGITFRQQGIYTPSGGGFQYVAYDNNIIGPDPDANPYTTWGIQNTASDNFWAHDNVITNVGANNDCIDFQGNNVEIVGNVCDDLLADGIHSAANASTGTNSNILIAWNRISSLKFTTGHHPDFFQIGASGITAASDNVRYIGNIAWRKNGTSGQQEGQGYNGPGAGGGSITNFVACGNFYLGTFVNGMTPDASTSGIIQFNTIITDNVGVTNSSTSNLIITSWNGGSVSNNIYSRFQNITQVVAPTIANNFTARFDGVGGSLYTDYFVNPQAGANVTDPVAMYSVKPGSDPDNASPKAGAFGTGYFDYTNRTHSEPGAVCGGG